MLFYNKINVDVELCCNFLNRTMGVFDRVMFQPSTPNMDIMKACSGTGPPSDELPNA